MDTKVKIISMDEIQAEEIKSLWKPYIPFGKLTIYKETLERGKLHLFCVWQHNCLKVKDLMRVWR